MYQILSRRFIAKQIYLLGLLLVLILFSFPSLAKADWSMVGSDPQHSQTSTFQISQKPEVLWSHRYSNDPLAFSAVASQTTVYENTLHTMYAFDKQGVQKWTYNATVREPFLDSNQNLYFANWGCNTKVTSINSQGVRRWEYLMSGAVNDCSSMVSSPITTSPNRQVIYTALSYPANSIFALNLDGSLRWKTKLEGQENEYSSVVAAPDGTLYMGTTLKGPRQTDLGHLFALSSDGKVLWRKEIGFNPNGAYSTPNPVVGTDGSVYIQATQAKRGDTLVSFDKAGNQRWKLQLPDSINDEDLAIKDQTIYATNYNILYAINTQNGTIRWQWNRGSSNVSLHYPVIDKNGMIIVSGTSTGSSVFGITPQGSLQWTAYVQGFISSAPIIPADNLIYIPSNIGTDGVLTALGQNPNTPPAGTRVPLIIIPGIMGSELKVKNDTNWSQPDGHGGTYTHTYPKDEKVWVNTTEAFLPGNDDYFDILKLNYDGVTTNADLELTGELEGTYKKTIDYFINQGYELNKTLFVFPYDWRKDLQLTSPLLDQKVDQIRNLTGQSKVDIITHSMGGLVARNYIQDSAKATKVRKLFTIAAPHLGSVEFIKNLRYGGCITYPEILKNSACIGVPDSETKDLIQNMSGAYQLAPTKQYEIFYTGEDKNHPLTFFDGRDGDKNGQVGPLKYGEVKNLLAVEGYNTNLYKYNETLHQLDYNLANTNGVDITIIAGSGKPTPGQIIENFAYNLAGLKIGVKNELIAINGDKTVPLFSAALEDIKKGKYLQGPAKTYYAEDTHSRLPSNDSVLTLVMNKINNSLKIPGGIQSAPFTLEGKIVSVHSPVNIHIYDQSGNHTGPISEGEFEENIPGSSYETVGDAKFIYLPENGVYQTKLEATDQGQFDLKIRTYSEDENTQTTLYKALPLETTTKGEVLIDTTSQVAPTIKLDKEGNGTVDTQYTATSVLSGSAASDMTPPTTAIELTGDSYNNVFSSNVLVELTATDEASGSGIAKTEYSLDDGKTVQSYSQPITISTEGITQLIYRSFDKAGNEELSKIQEIKINKSPTAFKGEYFSNMTLTGTPTVIRFDPVINFNYGSGAPIALLPTNRFSIRWSGVFTVPKTGLYTFYTTSDEGLRLYINNILGINRWNDQTARTFSYTTPAALSDGAKIPVVMEYFDNAGVASAVLEIQGPDNIRKLMTLNP